MKLLTLGLLILFKLTIALWELTLDTNIISRRSEEANYRALILCWGGLIE